jgi:lipopolysaccharide/colanic/teichoic acid biosynthesis glycosyltransferase
MQDSLGLNTVTGASRQYYYLKRAMDIVLTLVLLLLVWPLMLLIAVLIKIDSRGPIFFVQKRVGARRRYSNGQVVWEITTFNMMKFRSMFQDAEQSLHQEYIKAYVEGRENLAQTEGDESIHKLQYDPRITRVGRIIRKTSMDELPQLFNVLKGEMSLVGPRPVPTYEFESYQPWHRERMNALPGISGLWQVTARCQVPFNEQIQLDVDYVRRQSLWLDISILLRTIPAVISGRGAG